MQELIKLYEQHPNKLPLSVVTTILGINEDGLKAVIHSGRCPFGIGYQLRPGGNRVSVVPTIPFLAWYTNGKIFEYIGELKNVQHLS